MWLIRFHLLKTKDYNYINRKLKKCGFFCRKNPPILFIKSSVLYLLEKKSWRIISEKLWVNHIQLFKFYSNYKNNPELKNIFHYLADQRIIVYLWEEKKFNIEEIDNTSKFLKLTKAELSNIFKQ